MFDLVCDLFIDTLVDIPRSGHLQSRPGTIDHLLSRRQGSYDEPGKKPQSRMTCFPAIHTS